MDYSVWAILESKANAKAHKNLEALQKAWKELNNETLRAIVDDFPKKLQACKDAQGGYFE